MAHVNAVNRVVALNTDPADSSPARGPAGFLLTDP